MGCNRLWCTVRVVGADGTALADLSIRGCGSPDLSVVDAVARVARMARRFDTGLRVVVADPSGEVCELVELTGLPVATHAVEIVRPVEVQR